MYSIREAHPDDLTALRELFLQVRRNTYAWLNTSGYLLTDFDEETADEYILVAMDENRMIGFISIWLKENFIHHLYVDSRYQDKSVGSELLKTAIGIVNAPVRLKCLELNANAISFYRRKGAIEIGGGISEDGPYILFELG